MTVIISLVSTRVDDIYSSSLCTYAGRKHTIVWIEQYN